MPVLKMIGFTPTQEAQLDQTYRDADTAIGRALHALVVKHPDYIYFFNTYFGSGEGDSREINPRYLNAAETLKLTLQSMQTQLNRRAFRLEFEPDNPNNAEAQTVTLDPADKKAWKASVLQQNPDKMFWRKKKQEYITSALATIEPMIAIAPSYFGLPERSPMFSSQLLTYVHELSHLAAGTKDQEHGVSSCYGPGGCAEVLRVLGSEKAVKNAESIAFFTIQFDRYVPTPTRRPTGNPPIRPVPTVRPGR